MAEAQGFEPWEPCGSSVFKTGAISQTLPNLRIVLDWAVCSFDLQATNFDIFAGRVTLTRGDYVTV
jgi:hypothetical protein